MDWMRQLRPRSYLEKEIRTRTDRVLFCSAGMVFTTRWLDVNAAGANEVEDKVV